VVSSADCIPRRGIKPAAEKLDVLLADSNWPKINQGFYVRAVAMPTGDVMSVNECTR